MTDQAAGGFAQFLDKKGHLVMDVLVGKLVRLFTQALYLAVYIRVGF